jgi:hypothetical protein
MHTKRVQEDPNSSFASMRNIRFMTEENWIIEELTCFFSKGKL